jgi:flavin reductase (DIM6/NTAB) family NADH-FMN oxidoreductase RutF
MPVDDRTFRHVMSHFVTGVTIVTMRHGERRRGMTANAFCALSLTPPLVLVCVVVGGETNVMLREAGHFAVNILRADQQDLATRFAGRPPEDQMRFDDLPTIEGVTGAPIIAGSLAYAECRITAMYDGGDHTIFVGEMLAGDALQEGQPLAFYRRRYRDLLVEAEEE